MTLNIFGKLYGKGINNTKGSFVKIHNKKALDKCIIKNVSKNLTQHTKNDIKADAFKTLGFHPSRLLDVNLNESGEVVCQHQILTHQHAPIDKRVCSGNSLKPTGKVITTKFLKVKGDTFTSEYKYRCVFQYKDFVESFKKYEFSYTSSEKAEHEGLIDDLEPLVDKQKLVDLGTDRDVIKDLIDNANKG